MQILPSTILWKDGTSTKVWLSLQDTQTLVQAFLGRSTDILNIQDHPNGKDARYFIHIDMACVKAVFEGFHTRCDFSVAVGDNT